MKSMMRFFNDDSGADLVEYALLVGVVALGAITGLNSVRDAIVNMFKDLATKVVLPTPTTP